MLHKMRQNAEISNKWFPGGCTWIVLMYIGNISIYVKMIVIFALLLQAMTMKSRVKYN